MFDTLELLKQGGWTMVPLGLCSVAAGAIIIERAFALRRRNVLDARVLRAINAYTDGAPPETVANACRDGKSPLARIIVETLQTRDLDYHQAIEKMHAAGRLQVGSLERGLTVLEIIAAVSPLLGLLGTVLGMVTVFNAISAAGLGDPNVLSAGISKALITTVAGLCIAIPALAFHGLYMKRAEDLATEMQDRATEFIVRLHAPGNAR